MTNHEKKELLFLEAEIYRDFADAAKVLSNSLDNFDGKVLNVKFKKAIMAAETGTVLCYLSDDSVKHIVFHSAKSNHSEPDKNGCCIAYYPENKTTKQWFSSPLTDSNGRIIIANFKKEMEDMAKIFICRAENLIRDTQLISAAIDKYTEIEAEIDSFKNNYSSRLRELFNLKF